MNPNEPPFREQFRDSKTHRPDDIVYRQMPPEKDIPPHMYPLWCLLERYKIQNRLLWEDLLHHRIFFVKKPAYEEQPFYSDPRVKVFAQNIAGGQTAFTTLWSVAIPGRYGLVLTGVGMDVGSCPLPDPQKVAFRYQLNGETINVFDDNSAAPAGIASFEPGVFSLPLGTFANPLNLKALGIAKHLRTATNTNLVLQAQNIGAGTVCLKVITTWYTYRYDHAYQDGEQAEYIW